MRRPLVPVASIAALLLLLTAVQGQAQESKTVRPLTITFVGDIMLDGGPGHIVTNQGDPFVHVAPALRGSDVTVGNLECAITRKGHAQDKTYTFKAPLASLPLLKSYFSAVSLANNHSGDWGPNGFADELQLLRDNRIAWFGGGRNEREAHSPLIIVAKGWKIALLGYNEYPPTSFAATANRAGTAWLVPGKVLRDIALARQHADLVLLYLHWGEELESTPTKGQTELARRLIDAGADAIIGSHPHVTQTIEWYRDRPIVYSLGNFVFDYFPTDPPVWTSYMLQLNYEQGARPTLTTLPIEIDPSGIPHIATIGGQ